MSLAAWPWLRVLAGFAIGALLGWAYFGALHLTLERLPASRRPALLVLASYAARIAVALVVLLLIVRWAQGPGVLAALAGFVLARGVRVRRARRELSAGDRTRSPG